MEIRTAFAPELPDSFGKDRSFQNPEFSRNTIRKFYANYFIYDANFAIDALMAEIGDVCCKDLYKMMWVSKVPDTYDIGLLHRFAIPGPKTFGIR